MATINSQHEGIYTTHSCTFKYDFPVQRLYAHWTHNAGVSIRLSIGLSRRPQPNWGLITQCSIIIRLCTFNIIHVLHNLPGVNYTCPHVHYTCTHSISCRINHSTSAFTTSTGYHNCTTLKHSNTNDQIIITWVKRFEETKKNQATRSDITHDGWC